MQNTCHFGDAIFAKYLSTKYTIIMIMMIMIIQGWMRRRRGEKNLQIRSKCSGRCLRLTKDDPLPLLSSLFGDDDGDNDDSNEKYNDGDGDDEL